MNALKVLGVMLFTGILMGCDTEDDNDIDSVLVKRNEYKVVEFTLKPGQQVNITVTDLSSVLAETSITDPDSYDDWVSDTQNSGFEGADIYSYYHFPPLSGKHSSGWQDLHSAITEETTFLLFFENTVSGLISPPAEGPSASSTMMYHIDIRNKP